MPSGMVRPRASQVPRLGAGAIAEYLERGWRITPHGRLDAGTTLGPCALCGTPHELYGPYGRPLCPACRTRQVPS